MRKIEIWKCVAVGYNRLFERGALFFEISQKLCRQSVSEIEYLIEIFAHVSDIGKKLLLLGGEKAAVDFLRCKTRIWRGNFAAFAMVVPCDYLPVQLAELFCRLTYCTVFYISADEIYLAQTVKIVQRRIVSVERIMYLRAVVKCLYLNRCVAHKLRDSEPLSAGGGKESFGIDYVRAVGGQQAVHDIYACAF